MSKWRVGIYLRLSSEDKSKISDESNSITNQRELIKSYISKDKSLELINVYMMDLLVQILIDLDFKIYMKIL